MPEKRLREVIEWWKNRAQMYWDQLATAKAELAALRVEVERNTSPADDKRMTPEEWGEAWRDRALELQRCGVCEHWGKSCSAWYIHESRFHTCPNWKFGG